MDRLTEALRSATPSPGWVAEMRRKYPFFTIAMAMELASCTDDDERRRMMLRLRLASPSPEAMEQLAGKADPRFAAFYPPVEKPRTPDTGTAIDDFLARYATTTPEEEALLERMIFNPVPDYAQQLAREADDTLPATPAPESDSQDDRISRFILANPPGTAGEPAEIPPAQTPPAPSAGTPDAAPAKSVRRKSSGRRQQSPEPGENTLLSESLAKIYIKSHKYERAFEILSRLSLEFPEKSRYFADQLRFLRKLIIIQQHRDQSSAPSDEGAPTEKN
ncbi:MAG: hypothetical protein K2I51_08130 [Muribaculaceae bacterium]|nr:hypothetical protein [Muribaculaceae bacterium]